MLFGTELETSKNLNRPLSKLKRDILTEIGLLKNGKFKSLCNTIYRTML